MLRDLADCGNREELRIWAILYDQYCATFISCNPKLAVECFEQAYPIYVNTIKGVYLW
jgi:hypothetical protein